MRRPDNTILRSASSSRHDNNASSSETNLQAKTIGCMSGILHLFSKHHTSRKFITFGKKHEKNACSSITKSTGGGEPSSSSSVNYVERLSSNTVPRSPTLPADIRLSNSAATSRTPSASLVTRLMGLEQSPPTTSTSTLIKPKTAVVPNKYSTTTATTTTTSTNQKREQLLGALDKCDQDLKALKKIIDAVRTAEVLRSSPPPPSSTSAMNTYNGNIKRRFANNNIFKCLEFNGEQQPSPVSVLLDDEGYDDDDDDEGTTTRSTIRSPLSFRNHHHHYHYHYDYHSRKQLLNSGRVQEAQQMMRQQQQIRKKKLGQEDFIDKMITTESSLPVALLQKESSGTSIAQGGYTSSPLWNSKAMVESVAEVCRDIAWGERREIGRIGFALQDHICKDLIQEIVTDVMECDPDTRSCGHSSLSLSLPFEACKRRLCF